MTEQPTSSRRHSVHMEEVDDEDNLHQNVPPLNRSHVLKLSDRSDDEIPHPTAADDSDDDNNEGRSDLEDAEESAEAELG